MVPVLRVDLAGPGIISAIEALPTNAKQGGHPLRPHDFPRGNFPAPRAHARAFQRHPQLQIALTERRLGRHPFRHRGGNDQIPSTATAMNICSSQTLSANEPAENGPCSRAVASVAMVATRRFV